MLIMIPLRWIRIDSEEDAERYIERKLWGYPRLVRKFREEVRPALVEARKKEREKEMEQQQETTTEHDGNNVLDLEPGNVGQDKETTVASSVTPQTSQPASFDDGSVPLVTTQVDVQPRSQVEVDDHPSLLSRRNIEVLRPMASDPNPPLDVHLGEE